MAHGAAEKQYTAAEMASALEKANGVVNHAADILGCGRATIYRYAAEYVTVKRALEQSREELVIEARDRMSEMMRTEGHKDQYKATLKVLTVYDDEHDWSDKERRELTGKDGGAVQVIFERKSKDE